jgi:hypothetical protein
MGPREWLAFVDLLKTSIARLPIDLLFHEWLRGPAAATHAPFFIYREVLLEQRSRETVRPLEEEQNRPRAPRCGRKMIGLSLVKTEEFDYSRCADDLLTPCRGG